MRLSMPLIVVMTLFLLGGAPPTFAQATPGAELGEIKQILTEQERTISVLKDRVAELEAEATPPAAAATDPSGEEADGAASGEDVSSVEAVRRLVPSGEKARARTSCPGAASRRITFPVAASHNTTPSEPPAAARAPSGESAEAWIGPNP